MPRELLADLAAVLHGLVVLFVAGGLLAILLGLWRRWAFARGFWFRYAHLWTCLVIFVFECANQPCPLTTLEKMLRTAGYEKSFIEHYISESIHVALPPRALAAPMLLLFLLVIALYLWAGPQKPAEAEGAEETSPPAKPAPAWRQASMLALLVVLAAGCFPLNLYLSHTLGPALVALGWMYPLDEFELTQILLLLESLLLCGFTLRTSGLGFGAPARWRRHDLKLAAVWAVPPMAVALVYAHLEYRPHEGLSPSEWLWGSIAQELFFSGFVYARLAALFGDPGENWRGAFSKPMLLTPVLFALWHWPNCVQFQAHFMALQFTYTFLGRWWMLNLRRWTGSAWPGAACHVMVNFLASVA